jgi:ABC-type Fe3+-siderophore transport system permease subunit
MLKNIFKLLLGFIFAIVLGILSFAVFGASKVIVSDVVCNLQTNETYTCTVKQRITDISYQVSENQIENVVGIGRDAPNTCKRNCAWKVEFELASGETTPVRDHYGDADIALAMVNEVSSKIKIKEETIQYTLDINRFWDLYFPALITFIIAGAMIIQSIVSFINNIRYRN